jgi:hypothetical protein
MCNERKAGLARLIKSKQEFAESENAAGLILGRKWACDNADYVELKRIAEIDRSDYVSEHDLARAILGEADASVEFEILEEFFDTKRPSLDMVAGFIDGAVEVFAEVP